MSDQATILHADLDAFFASVEQRDDPALRGKPVLVGGGVVTAASYEAKSRGVSTPISLAQARAICPDAVLVRPRMAAYSAASKEVFAILREFSPTVEALSIDEAFLDAGGMEHIHGSPLEIGRKLRAAVHERAGLMITVGIARTKFLAKVASGAAKPDGLLLVEPDGEREFLNPLAIEALWGVGKVTSKKLRARGARTVGDIAAMSEQALVDVLGPGSGHHLHALASGRDPRRVEKRQRRRSIGAQHAISNKQRSQSHLDTIVTGLIDRVAPRLRDSGRSARTVVLRVRFGDFTRITRSRTLPRASSQGEELLAAARDLLRETMPLIEANRCTLIGVSLANLEDGRQLEMAFDGPGASEVDATVDAVRDRFGKESITRGVLLGKDQGTAAPILPD